MFSFIILDFECLSKRKRTPDARVIAQKHLLLSGHGTIGVPDAAIFHEDSSADGTFVLSVSGGGERAGPGDVTVAGGVEGVAALGEDPFAAGEDFAEGKEIR